jgi:hypothetical protein
MLAKYIRCGFSESQIFVKPSQTLTIYALGRGTSSTRADHSKPRRINMSNWIPRVVMFLGGGCLDLLIRNFFHFPIRLLKVPETWYLQFLGSAIGTLVFYEIMLRTKRLVSSKSLLIYGFLLALLKISVNSIFTDIENRMSPYLGFWLMPDFFYYIFILDRPYLYMLFCICAFTVLAACFFIFRNDHTPGFICKKCGQGMVLTNITIFKNAFGGYRTYQCPSCKRDYLDWDLFSKLILIIITVSSFIGGIEGIASYLSEPANHQLGDLGIGIFFLLVSLLLGKLSVYNLSLSLTGNNER